MVKIEDINDATRNEAVVDIYGTYYNVIAPLTIQLESLDGDFPIAILNEIRAIFTHISRCCFTKDTLVYEDNIKKARNHTKRTILDCFKYLCLSYDEHYKRFEKLHANVDLSSVDNGDFFPQLKEMRKSSVDFVKKAKELDFKGEDEEKVYKSLFSISQRTDRAADFSPDNGNFSLEYCMYFKKNCLSTAENMQTRCVLRDTKQALRLMKKHITRLPPYMS